jgi:two-component system OmpR family response regulator
MDDTVTPTATEAASPVPADATAAALSPVPSLSAAAPASEKKRVLIIEDERPIAHALELKITREGYAAHCCLTGADGLKEALTGGYAAILIDLIMPEMDGFSVLEKLQEAGIHTPVIILSNLGQEEDKAKAKTLGAKEYFVKANTPIVDIVKSMKAIIV